MTPEATPWRYCGRSFSRAELDQIRELIAANPAALRTELSRLVCAKLGWSREDGRPKDMSCRVAMLRMQADGLLQLPPPRNGNHNGKPWRRRTALKMWTGWPTFPMVFVKGMLIGGADDLAKLIASGELKRLLA